LYAGPQTLETAGFRALMLQTAAALNQGRSEAISGAEEQVFLVDFANRRMGLTGSSTVIEWPAEVALTATVAQSEKAGNAAGIRFYPSGSSSGGVLAFSFRGQSYEIRVNWLTGNVTLARV
jgi:general secretion pathway protein H